MTTTMIRIFLRRCSTKVKTIRTPQYYQPDPSTFLDESPRNRPITILAYRISKDYVHYALSELDYHRSTIRLLDSKPFSLIGSESTNSKISIGGFGGQKDEIDADESDDDGEKELRKLRQRKRENARNVSSTTNHQSMARILEQSPTADAYLIERIPASTYRIKDRKVLAVFSEISMRTQVLRAQLVAKWMRERGGAKIVENVEATSSSSIASTSPSLSPIAQEPIFESNGRYVANLFELRKADTVCQPMVDIVRRLSDGYVTKEHGTIRAEIPERIVDDLCDEWNHRKEEEMEKHLLCSVILESLAFAEFLSNIRRSRDS